MSKILILIVEDEEATAEMYSNYFKQSGYEVDVSHDGLEGFEKMKAEQPALVLMDIVMPGLSGMEVVEKAKHEHTTEKIPIIMLTNYSDSVELKNALQQGAADYIVKSELTPKQIVERVQRFIMPDENNKPNKHKYLAS